MHRYGVIIAVALGGCAGTWARIDRATLPRAENHPNADAVVLDDDLTVRFSPEPLTHKPVVELSQRTQLRILRPGGEREARVAVSYASAFCSVVSFAARTIAPDGTEKHFGRGAAIDAPAFGDFELYSDERALQLRLSPATPGTVIEYRYTTRCHEPPLVGIGQSFGDRHPARRVRLTVIAPRGWAIGHTAQHLGEAVDFAPTVVEAGDTMQAVWERRDVAALPSEPLAPAPALLTTRVDVRLTRWTEDGHPMTAPRDARELSAWLHELTRTSGGGRLPPTALDMAWDVTDPTARAQRLYEWVQKNVTYCAIEVGLGGWRPHPAAEVMRLGYGDCKDKANLLKELLAGASVSSRLVVIEAHDGLPRRFAMSLHSFNHAILAIDLPGGTLLADPTSRTTPFGALPVSDQESHLLTLQPGGAPLGTAPASGPDDNTEELTLDLTARRDDLLGTFSYRARGHFADELRYHLVNVPQARQHQPLAAALGVATPPRLTDWAVEGARASQPATPISVGGRIQLRGASAAGRVQLVSLPNLIESSVPSLPASERLSPIVLPCRRHTSDRIRISFDSAAEISSLPPEADIERPFGRYQLRWTREEHALAATRTLTLREHVFPARRYGEVKQFFDEILAAEARAATIRRSAP